jgi:hypothetical protein
MERDLLKRELEAVNISPKIKSWQYPKNEFDTTQIDDLINLFETSLIFGEYYADALKNKFSIKGRISIINAQYFHSIGGPGGSLGITDKKKGQAFLVEIYKRAVSTIEAALHEAIHLISHPLRGNSQNDMTFGKRFGYPLMEAVTQYFTRVMMIEAGIKNWKTSVYQKEINAHLKPFFKVFTLLRIDEQKRMPILCELVFKDNVGLLVKCMKQQFAVINNSLSANEITNWVSKTFTLLGRRRYSEAANLIEYVIQEDYKKAGAIYTNSMPKP